MAGVLVPQIAYKHAYVVTESIEGIKTCPNVRDHDGSVYLKRQGDTLQVGGYEPNPILWEKVRNNYIFWQGQLLHSFFLNIMSWFFT